MNIFAYKDIIVLEDYIVGVIVGVKLFKVHLSDKVALILIKTGG